MKTILCVVALYALLTVSVSSAPSPIPPPTDPNQHVPHPPGQQIPIPPPDVNDVNTIQADFSPKQSPQLPQSEQPPQTDQSVPPSNAKSSS